ncbi:hypothetical protein CAP35_04660 [Chitinophagaceae bacterium IBVUCB1]|nr:hypothetical protein CAP35_04660 [Chitinophagaceae bacterium IBVUCB1]
MKLQLLFRQLALLLCFSSVYNTVVAQQSFSTFFKEKFLYDAYLHDSALVNPSSPIGPYPYTEEEYSKNLSNFRKQLEKFYPYGDFKTALLADSMLALRLSYGSCSTGNWQLVGPIGDPLPSVPNPLNPGHNSNKNGRLDCIAFKAGDTNIVYVGSGSGGGLWKVNITTGAGQSLNTEKISSHTGVGAVVSVPGRIVIATGRNLGKVWYSEWEFSCTGVYYTENEGLTWARANVTDKYSLDPFSYSVDKRQWVSKIAVHPTNPDIMYMTVYNVSVVEASSDPKNYGALFKSTNGGKDWLEVNDNSLANRYFKDIEFNPIHPDTIYLGSHLLYRSLNGGNTWTDVTSILQNRPSKGTESLFWSSHEILISVPEKGCATGDGDNVLVFASSTQNTRNIWNLYHSTDALSSSISDVMDAFDKGRISWASPFHAGFTVSHDPDTLYLGGIMLQASYDGGSNFATNHQNDYRMLHADINTIKSQPYSGNNGGVITVCTDGGLYRSNDYGITFRSLNDGLSITQFYGMAVSQTDNTLLGGSQDNHAMRKNNDGTWQAYGIGDAGHYCTINSNNTEQTAYYDFFNSPESITVEGAGINDVFVGPLAWSPPFTFLHNEPSTLLVASERLIKQVNGVITDGTPFWRCLGADSVNWLSQGNTATAMGYCYSNSNVMYIATTGQFIDGQGRLIGRDTNVNTGDVNGYTKYNLFKTTDGGATWTDISLNSLSAGRSGYISSIQVHPQYPDTFWVTFSGYAGKLTNGNYYLQNVLINTTGGTVYGWDDYNTGLPYGSTRDIVYQHGSNNLLYVALESGIYYRDRSMSSWQCLDKGLPITNITDLDISYCTGKLYASTFGRGIWATDLLNYPSNSYNGEIIGSNTTWSGSRYVTGNVHIKPGKTLTITGTNTVIGMPKNARIFVDSGAALVVENAKITNGCDGCMWKGIQLGGKSGKDQSLITNTMARYQGMVTLTGATIENAIIGIENTNGVNTTAGVINATNTKFLNNSRAIYLHGSFAGAPYYHKNNSRFTGCYFDMNNNFKGGASNYFQAHADLFNIEGLIFSACTFRNGFTGQYRGQGYGIRATEAGFTVTRYKQLPNGQEYRSYFNGLLYGVYADKAGGSAFPFRVDYSNFDSCTFGVRGVNISGIPQISRDTFNLGDGVDGYIGFDCKLNVGIFMTATPFMLINSNYFKGINHANQHPNHQNWGTIIEDCGGENNEINSCIFKELDKANVAWGKNKSMEYPYPPTDYNPFFTGLRYLCNSFTGDTTDIEVSGAGLRSGIAAWQGEPGKSAGNLFSGTGYVPIKDYTMGWFRYYHAGGSSYIPNAYVHNYSATTSRHCNLSGYYDGGAIDRPYVKGEAGLLKAALGEKMTDLIGLLDGGNTPSVISYINGSTVADSPTVRTTLLGYAPYLTEAAARAIADKDILSTANLIQVLSANPDILDNPQLLDFLENDIPTPLNSSQISALRTASHSSTERTTKEARIAEDKYQLNIAIYHVLLSIMEDSTCSECDSIPVWYDHLNSLSAEYAKVGYYTSIEDYTSASAVLNGMDEKFDMTEGQIEELENYIDFWTVYKNAKQDGRTIYELTSAEQATLTTIINGTYPNDRPNIATTITVMEPGLPVRLPCIRGELFSNKNTKSQPKPKDKGVVRYLKAYPNPTKDILTFEYILPEADKKYTISVVNVLGQTVKQIPINAGACKYTLDVREMPSGVYSYRLMDNNKIIERGKVVISR